MGNAYFNQQDYEQAIIYFQKAIDINPNYADAFCNMGIAYNEKSELNKRDECYTQAKILGMYGLMKLLGTTRAF